MTANTTANRAKKHSVLADITGAISSRIPECVEEVVGVKYKLRLLKPEADDWVANNTPGSTVSAALYNLRKPTVAAALVSIDTGGEEGELHVEQLWQLPDDMDAAVKERIREDGKLLRDWRREQILEWLREEHDAFVIDQLYAAYARLIPKHRDALKGVEDFLKRTPSAE